MIGIQVARMDEQTEPSQGYLPMVAELMLSGARLPLVARAVVGGVGSARGAGDASGSFGDTAGRKCIRNASYSAASASACSPSGCQNGPFLREDSTDHGPNPSIEVVVCGVVIFREALHVANHAEHRHFLLGFPEAAAT